MQKSVLVIADKDSFEIMSDNFEETSRRVLMAINPGTPILIEIRKKK